MRCPNCNVELSSKSLRFCSSCGTKLAEPTEQPKTQPIATKPNTLRPVSTIQQDFPPEKTSNSEPEFDIGKTAKEIQNTIKHNIDNVSRKYNTKYNIPERLVPEVVKECDSEKHIKQYEFMHMSLPIAGYKATGLLQVTNKRIIYNSIGSSIMGNEYMHSEVSIDDVAGISVEKSTSLNIFVILAFCLLGLPLTLFGCLIGASGLLHPIIPLILAGAAAFGTMILLKTKHYVFLHLLASVGSSICLGGIGIACMRLLRSIFSGNSGGGFVTTLIALLFIFLSAMNTVSYVLNLFKNNISIKVTSKSGAATPIDCSSDQSWLAGMSMLKPLIYMYETEDTPIMEAELGAMVSDIQKLGDYGLEKWVESENK